MTTARALHDLDEPHLAEMREQHAEGHRADRHAEQQHRAEQRDDARPRTRSGARSVASARPTVCTVCSPAPTSRNASAAAACPIQSGPVVSPDRISSANGMIAKPPNCSIVPNQMNGTRRQPSTER